MVQHMPSVYKALDSIPSTTENGRRERWKERRDLRQQAVSMLNVFGTKAGDLSLISKTDNKVQMWLIIKLQGQQRLTVIIDQAA